jgi:hypothetical protein
MPPPQSAATTQSYENLETAALVQRAMYRHCFSRSTLIRGAAEQVAAIERKPSRRFELRSSHEIDDQGNNDNGSENAAAEIHNLPRWPN